MFLSIISAWKIIKCLKIHFKSVLRFFPIKKKGASANACPKHPNKSISQQHWKMGALSNYWWGRIEVWIHGHRSSDRVAWFNSNELTVDFKDENNEWSGLSSTQRHRESALWTKAADQTASAAGCWSQPNYRWENHRFNVRCFSGRKRLPSC